ncbi:hypothetical protein N658DRAFT_149997 [Parathielavia hyrcaniae]|uniref:Uncharacterized protein n=1 Tax=Parathielavia hyrcaniae TaxID=113614 RepID=A0AAN6T068_9PEZI|nr:hypothetical protein N658DRAFT_149997 [Parathielavia hyrcaniae]
MLAREDGRACRWAKREGLGGAVRTRLALGPPACWRGVVLCSAPPSVPPATCLRCNPWKHNPHARVTTTKRRKPWRALLYT